jgi:hypothetical protein
MTCFTNRATVFRAVSEGFYCRLCNARIKHDDLERHKNSKGHRKMNRRSVLRGFGDGKPKEMA